VVDGGKDEAEATGARSGGEGGEGASALDVTGGSPAESGAEEGKGEAPAESAPAPAIEAPGPTEGSSDGDPPLDPRVPDRREGAKGDGYPTASERELRRAGFGCLALVTVGALVIYLVFAISFAMLSEPTQEEGAVSSVVESTPVPREEPRPRREPTLVWGTDFEAATAIAEAEEKPLLVLFEAAWSSGSADMREGSFEDPSVAELVASFVPVRLQQDDASNEALTTRYDVRFVPHVLLLDSAGERLRQDILGLASPDDLRVILSDALEVHRERVAAAER
jgi:hypothetical protein